jgi:hypothetical protein
MEWWNVLIAAGAAVAGIFIKWALDKFANKYADAALKFLDQVIVESVYAVNQVYVDAIKLASEDGTLTDEEKAEAKAKAWDYIFRQIPPKFLAALKELFGSAEALSTRIDVGIESAVKAAKEEGL